jgi:outer membrane protein OmpA-like peptidoglycan-associated protein
MVVRKARFLGRRCCRAALVPAALLLVAALAACDTVVDTWRDMQGVSKNDPDPATTPNASNLAAGEAGDYPNLASVPPPPSRATSTADREKLTESLVADRANAKYSDEKLRAGFGAVSAPPPSAPPPPAAPPLPPSGLRDEPGTPPSGAAASAAPPPPPAAPPPATPPSAGARAAGARAGTAVAENTPGEGFRKAGQPPEPGAAESSLEMPQVRSTPSPDAPRRAPPAASLPPTKTAAVAGGAAPGTPATAPRIEGPPPPTPLPPAIGSTAYQPPPAAPVLAPPPTRPAVAAPKGGQKKPPSVSTRIAEIAFPADTTSLPGEEAPAIDKIVETYKQNPGTIRIVGYASGTAGRDAVEQLNAFRGALDRAQAVSKALAQKGIPADKIQVEAAPTGTSGSSRAEVMLEY